MAGTDDKKNGTAPAVDAPEETVDDILAGILNKDGSFNEEFGGLLTKYLGDDAAHISSLRNIDLSDRAGEQTVRRYVEYEAPEAAGLYGESFDMHIEERMPEDMRAAYYAAAYEAQHPEFMSTGGVRYPAMGVGASEERVVYDAEWEESARREAARLRRVREERMLRGDSTYVRSFVAGGRSLGSSGRPSGSPYIDPLSADDDFDDPYGDHADGEGDRNPFFREGPPASQIRSNTAGRHGAGGVGGRTGDTAPVRRRVYDGHDPFAESATNGQDKGWLQVETVQDEHKKGRGGKKKRRKQSQITTTISDDYESPVVRTAKPEPPEKRAEKQSDTLTQPKKGKKQAPSEQERESAEQTAEGLRSTVAEIVDKYNKRSEDEAAAREKAEREAREREEAQRREREELMKSLSPEIISAMNDDSDDGYDDFSDVSDTVMQDDAQGNGSSGGEPIDYSSFIESASDE